MAWQVHNLQCNEYWNVTSASNIIFILVFYFIVIMSHEITLPNFEYETIIADEHLKLNENNASKIYIQTNWNASVGESHSDSNMSTAKVIKTYSHSISIHVISFVIIFREKKTREFSRASGWNQNSSWQLRETLSNYRISQPVCALFKN